MAHQYKLSIIGEGLSDGKVLTAYINMFNRLYIKVGDDEVTFQHIAMGKDDWETLKCYVDREFKKVENE